MSRDEAARKLWIIWPGSTGGARRMASAQFRDRLSRHMGKSAIPVIQENSALIGQNDLRIRPKISTWRIRRMPAMARLGGRPLLFQRSFRPFEVPRDRGLRLRIVRIHGDHQAARLAPQVPGRRRLDGEAFPLPLPPIFLHILDGLLGRSAAVVDDFIGQLAFSRDRRDVVRNLDLPGAHGNAGIARCRWPPRTRPESQAGAR